MEAFIFIQKSGRQDQKESNAGRLRIRRHAMCSAASDCRERGGYGQHNRQQLPVFVETTNFQDVNAAPSHEPSSSVWEVDLKLLSCPSTQGYKAARIRHRFDILSLSALIAVYLSRQSVTIMCSNPHRMQKLVGHSEASWLDFMPALYPESKILQSAVDCTLARAHPLLYPLTGTTEAAVINLYLKAIAELQAALSNPSRCVQIDVLCATQILAFYEVSDFV